MVLLGFSLTALAKRAFIENIGQITDQYQNKRPDIIAKYQADNGLNIFLSNSGIHYQWAKENEMYRMDVKLLGANPNPRISKEAATDFKEQYQLADLKGTAKGFERIVYHEVYPGIDWEFYFNPDGKLEHDFIVKPGGKVANIKLQYAGANHLKIDRFGNLIATTKYGKIVEPAPYSYEQGSNKKISSAYVLNHNILTFKTGAYNGTLVIDPVISWASYIGGSEYEEVWDTKVGADGMVYVTGATNSTTNIATLGAHLTAFAGGTNTYGSDIFLRKYDTDGHTIWSTYAGGPGVELGMAMAIDTTGYIYLAGRSNSQTGIATTGAYQEVKAGSNASYDAYIMKFDTAGQQMYGTYYGGSSAEGTEKISIALDRYNNIYLAGNTQSNGSIATANAFQSTRPGGHDGFIAKFSPAFTRAWGTYFGTSSNDYINAITNDTSGRVIVVGHTESTTGLSTTGTGNGGTDGFIAKLDSAGNRLWAVYYGGPDYDRLATVCTDSSNKIYFLGSTESTSGIATTAAHQVASGGGIDICFGKLDSNGAIQYSSYYGGAGNDIIGKAVFHNGSLYFTGETTSPSGITTANGITPTYNSSPSEIFLALFSASGSLNYGTYLGGDYSDGANTLAIDDNNDVYLGGKTSSLAGMATTGAEQATFSGIMDGMLMKISMCSLPENPVNIAGNTTVCEGSGQVYTIPQVAGADAYLWLLPTGWSGTSTSDIINVSIGNASGDIKVVAINSCGQSDTTSLTIIVQPAPQPVISRSGNILSVTTTFPSYQWLLNGAPISGATGPTHATTVNGDYSLQVAGSNGCLGQSNIITVDNGTGIDDPLAGNGITIYPNPFSQELTIDMPEKGQLGIIDISGKTVYSCLLEKNRNRIMPGKLAAGSYIISIYGSKGQLIGSRPISKILP